MPISSASLLVVIVINTLLGLVIYLQARHNPVTRSFFAIIASVFLWATPLFLYGLTDDLRLAMILSKISYLAAAMSALALVNFSIAFSFTSQNKTWRNILSLINILVPAALGVLLSGNSVWRGFSTFNGIEKVIEFGPYYPVYVGFITCAFTAGFLILYFNYRVEIDSTKRKQFQYIFIGVLFTVAGGVVTNLVLPSFGDFSFYWLGPIFTLIMGMFFTVSILKHQLFNAKVIATELFVFALWITILMALILSYDSSAQLLNGVLLTLTVIVGIFLIRSVYREVAQREKIEKLAEELTEANKRQETLIHFVSHEVKGYMTKSEGAFAAIIEGDVGVVSPEAKDLAELALAEDRKGVKAVTDILEASNLKSGKVKYEMKSFDVSKLVRTEVENLRREADEKGLKLETKISEGVTINGDERQIGDYVFGNLIKNSVFYTPSGTVIVSLEKKDGRAVFSVKDTGVGIAPDDKKILFTEGGRGKDAQKVNAHSTGYGLFIAKGIVDAHHGKIWAESAGAGKGSTFFVEMPAV